MLLGVELGRGSFEKDLVRLQKDVLTMDIHTLMQLLGEFLEIKHNLRRINSLRGEQEADIMLNVCKKELVKRGCIVEEFGSV